MSNYTKTTDFASKDSLSTGDAAKVVRGSEFETEFDAIATAIATKSDSAGPTFTGTLTFATISDGAISITAFVDEDNMASNSASLIPTQQSVKAYVDSQVATVDTLGEVLALSNTSSGTNIQMTTTDEIQFRDTALKIASSADGQLDIDADTEVEVTAPTVDINASTAVLVSNDLKLDSDSAVLGFGADNDTTLTHTDGAGLTLNSTNKLMFNDASQFIQGISATVLGLGATDEIDLTATLIDINGNVDVSGTVTATGTSVFASLDISGDIDVDGTTNLDIVDIDGAVDMASTLTVGGLTTIATGGNSAQLVLKSTDEDANVGPRLDLIRDSASPADGDLVGQIRFLGDNDAGEQTSYGFIRAKLLDVSDGTEEGQFDFTLKKAGSDTSRIRIQDSELIINDDSIDMDFRVESDGNTHGLFVDAGNNRVGILNSSPATALDVTGAISTSSGLYVGGTTSSNLLDDYEEGDWTPEAQFATTNPTAGATSGTGRYVKVGNLVTVWGHVQDIAVTGAAGDIRIHGLPFLSRLLANLQRYVGVVRFTNIDNSGFTNPVQIVPELQDNGQIIRIMVLRNNSTTDQINPASLSDGATDISITLSYETDA